MSRSKNTFKAIPGTTLRRLRNTPSYFFLIWRWTTWVFALIWIVANPYTRPQTQLAIFLLTLTFIQSLIVTLYAPVFQILFPWLPGFQIHPSRRPGPPLRSPGDAPGHPGSVPGSSDGALGSSEDAFGSSEDAPGSSERVFQAREESSRKCRVVAKMNRRMRTTSR